jgi:hypothetical protein
MYLVQLLLPLYDQTGQRFANALYDQTAQELTKRFGGLTAYTRGPAVGFWEARPGQTQRDDVVVYEVMVGQLETEWWAAYRRMLEQRFAQDELVVRAQPIQRL